MKKLMVPKSGVKVRDPISGEHLPKEGAVRNVSTYYNRRIEDGDLEARNIPKTKAIKTANKSKNSQQIQKQCGR